ncbi:MAG: hypothetical protein ABSD42_00950 [Candidatus Bathyarchaeia archaeon]|jgi:translation initiation factor 2 alpha subunit (eIF-2alpha)
MAERKSEWPEAGDLGIATIETVTDYGAYASNVIESGGQSNFRREK